FPECLTSAQLRPYRRAAAIEEFPCARPPPELPSPVCLELVVPAAEAREIVEPRRPAFAVRDHVVYLEAVALVAAGDHTGRVPCFESRPQLRRDGPSDVRDGADVGLVVENRLHDPVTRQSPGGGNRDRAHPWDLGS